MNKNIYCSRKGGATMGKKFYPAPSVSEILERQIAKLADKIHARRVRKKNKFMLGYA